MADNVLDFAIKVQKTLPAGEVSESYIKVFCVAVKPKATPTQPNGFYLITNKNDIALYTDNTEVERAFTSGATKLWLFVEDDLSLFGTYFDAESVSNFYTLIVSKDFNNAEMLLLNANKGTFDGVTAYTSDNIFAVSQSIIGTCFTNDFIAPVLHAFTKLFSLSVGDNWVNCQYIDAEGSCTDPLTSIGAEEVLYTDRVSFYGDSQQLGVKLLSFFHAKNPIVLSYIAETIKIRVQNAGFNYVFDNQSTKTNLTKQSLVALYSSIIQPFINNGLIDENFTINIEESGEDEFTLFGNISAKVVNPVWRQSYILNVRN